MIYLRTWLTRYSYILSLLGILLYNNWVIGVFVNWPATRAGATTSELSVHGQPWAMSFRVEDVITGVLLFLGAVFIVKLAQKTWQKWLLFLTTAIFGLSMIFDAFTPLDCSSALSQVCARNEQLGLVSWLDIAHTIESAIVYISLIILPLVFVLQTKTVQRKFGWLRFMSWVLLITMPVWGVETLWRFLHNGASFGFDQRAFDVLFTAWFILALYAAKTISKKKH